MSDKHKGFSEILSFLNSDKQCLRITGTHQNEKITLALAALLTEYPSPATILLRTNGMRNATTFLSPVLNLSRNIQTGTPINVSGGYRLYVDTINARTWRSSPRSIDVGVVYPIDSLKYDEGDGCVHDLLRRGASKVILVTWTDNQDISWSDQFDPLDIVYDAHDEDPDYHNRVLERHSTASAYEIKNLPAYAKGTPSRFLVKILCRRCSQNRWAELNKPYPGNTAIRDADMGDYLATCLRCGYIAQDNYNWSR